MAIDINEKLDVVVASFREAYSDKRITLAEASQILLEVIASAAQVAAEFDADGQFKKTAVLHVVGRSFDVIWPLIITPWGLWAVKYFSGYWVRKLVIYGASGAIDFIYARIVKPKLSA
jgi:hypothetical protein